MRPDCRGATFSRVGRPWSAGRRSRAFPLRWSGRRTSRTSRSTTPGMSYSTLTDIARQASTGPRLQGRDVGGRPSRPDQPHGQGPELDRHRRHARSGRPRSPCRRASPQAVEIAKIKNWGKLTPLYTEGTFAGKEVSRQGDSPFEFMYRDAIDGNDLRQTARPSGRLSCPGVYNADTLGIRPDLVGREITSWADLHLARLQGQDGDPEHPDQRHHGRDHGAARRPACVKYGDKGNPTQEELTADHRQADRAEEGRPLPRAVEHLRREREPDGRPARWSSSRCGRRPSPRSRRRASSASTSRSRKAIAAGATASALMAHLEGIKLDAAYEYLNWYNSGWVGGFIAKQGYYSANAETAKAAPDRERARLLLRGQGGDRRHHQPDRREDQLGRRHARRRLLRGALLARSAVWNNLMDEAEFLYAKWNEFNAA